MKYATKFVRTIRAATVLMMYESNLIHNVMGSKHFKLNHYVIVIMLNDTQ